MSDILIKNMKMPDNCEKCELSKAVITGLSTYRLCPILRRAWRRGESEPTCPLIEVPQHGRLIDADALDICKREQQAWQDYERNPDNEYLEGIKDGLHEASKQISTAMTIIEAEGT